MGRANWWSALCGVWLALVVGCEKEPPATDQDDDSAEREASEEPASAPAKDSGGPAGTAKADAGNGRLDARVAAGPNGSAVGMGAGALDGSANTGRADGAAADPSVDAAAGSPPVMGSPTGTFPAVTDLTAKGPFTAKTVESTGPGGAYTLYHPEQLAPEGVLNPVVSWGNGGATTPSLYPLLPHLASHGFVVIASNNVFVQAQHLRDGLDWLLMQNADASSPFYQKLDADNVSGVGYSNGGLATYGIADDPRLVTMVIISGGLMNDSARATGLPKLHTPVAYFCTDDDASEGNCKGDYDMVQVPTFFGVMNGSGHVDVVFNDGIIKLLNQVTTGWLRWQQMGDESLKPMFVGSDCALCKDSTWAVQPQKKLM